MRKLPALIAASLAIAGCTALALPAYAANTTSGRAPSSSQTLDVPATVPAPAMVEESFAARAPSVAQRLAGAAPTTPAATIASTARALGTATGNRVSVTGAALGYLGTPYVLGGASTSGIDCSGLIMRAYATAGVTLAHYVPTQDAAGTRISAADARPGDLIVFDDEEHIGMYLGAGLLVAAPAPGRDVEIEAVDDWSGIGYHFTRVLSD